MAHPQHLQLSQPYHPQRLFSISGGNVYSYVYYPATFTDTQSDYWAWDYIERLYKTGITAARGANPARFCPEQTVTRRQMAVFLERGLRGRTFDPGTPPLSFTDTASHWARYWIETLRANGITSGCGGGNFCPANPSDPFLPVSLSSYDLITLSAHIFMTTMKRM